LYAIDLDYSAAFWSGCVLTTTGMRPMPVISETDDSGDLYEELSTTKVRKCGMIAMFALPVKSPVNVYVLVRFS
jgi:hypothetical protein